MTGDPILVRIMDFVLWLGSALAGFGGFYFLGPNRPLKWSFLCMFAMILFLSFRDCLVAKLRRKITRRI
jgi:hypothetical protein